MNNIPKGYKLVPVEPTEEMLEVLHGSVEIQVDTWERTADIVNDKEWWAAVVDSAPTPPQPIYDEAKERELFEVWALEEIGPYFNKYEDCLVRTDHGGYVYGQTVTSWQAWCACAQSRAKSVEVGDE